MALAAFGLIRNNATDPLAKSINAYVMQDEARHVMFGRLALRDYYPQLTQRERDEREEFCVDACYRMRDRFLGEEVWERLGLPVAEVVEMVKHAELQLMFRGFLFTRIVPVLRDIGLWGPKIRAAFEDMGVMGFADADIDQLIAEDETIAEEIDQQRLAAVRASPTPPTADNCPGRDASGSVQSKPQALVAQWIEHLTTDQKVGGSTPSERAEGVVTAPVQRSKADRTPDLYRFLRRTAS